MTKGSRNRNRLLRKVRGIHLQIADRRLDHLQKIMHDLSQNHALVALEDLEGAGHDQVGRGTKDRPGKHVRQKSSLNRVILDQGGARSSA